MRYRSKSYVPALLLLVAVLSWSGCLFRSHKVAKRTTVTNVKSATLEDLVGIINRQAAGIKTLNATVDIDTSVGGAKKGKVTEYREIRGYILMRKPERLRMIGLFPVVRNRAFDMVSDAEGFKLYIAPTNKFVVGPPTVTKPSKNALENLRPIVIYNALLQQPIDPQNAIAVLEHTNETLVDSRTKDEVAFPTYTVDIIRKNDHGWHLSRKVVFSRIDLLIQHQLIYDDTGNLVTDVKYEDYKEHDGMEFPNSITIVRPQEEYTIGLSAVKLTLNGPIKDEQFELAQPPGSLLVRLGSNNGNKPENASLGGGTEKK